MQCLLIETNDNRKFFTHEKNYGQLIEFSKAFNAQISTVKIEKGPVLELEELAPAICDPTFTKQNYKYEIIETKNPRRTRGKTNQEASILITKYIEERFTSNKEVSLEDLKNKFKNYNISDATLRNHFRKTKTELESKGYKFEKIKVGTYKAV